jgi:glycosyltransferase involved in cell wall biosynthesis
MKISIIGPGYMPIPPKGWGAVESLIWDYHQILNELGHDVQIINTTDFNKALNDINTFNPDFVHIQYDDYIFLSNHIKKPTIVTSHYAYLEQPNKHNSYSNIFQQFLKTDATIFALSENIKNVYINYGKSLDKVFVVPNGVRDDLFKFNENCEYPDKSIYLAKIDFRKRQFLFHNIENLYFAGNIADNRYNRNNYLGEWSKEHLYNNLTNYANLVLLSDGEAHPLVCLEAMSAGLGLVISEFATANLDLSKPFIDVIPENKIEDIEYVSNVIKNNREKSINMRKEIREYVVNNFSWNNIINNYYLENLKKINVFK